MPFGDYDGPIKPNKGAEGGACNVTSCQAEPATHYNHGMYKWYCAACAAWIGGDVVNKRHWEARWQPELGHPQFETREMIDAREAPLAVPTGETVLFFREEHFYPVTLSGSKPTAEEVPEHVALNPGTTRVEDLQGNRIWPEGTKQ